ncbi:hypothetical protein Lfu02_44160 [Longispora fulva]|uniref:AcrR family transcriptional regulator n=1 Tax=Longispora fulva TaxID=619741 RepID=A0A8J7GRI6_9ACTN|nr:TetR/AcrR family transcriptional regulator [Longispora fulva]MBG6136873.1 AcrR family transcriptional regulator [Longispora fulva]GIG60044.1 hypothetical protein Lfu02_44160 [Longispora fulva]
MKTEEARGRNRNRRGEGDLLRGEILRGATAIIVRTGSDEAVTLRSVAREVGISAPSIYAHFPDRDAIVAAVVEEAFAQLGETVRTAADEYADPVASLVAGCAAYVGFGTREAARYQVLFGWARPKAESASEPAPEAGDDGGPVGKDGVAPGSEDGDGLAPGSGDGDADAAGEPDAPADRVVTDLGGFERLVDNLNRCVAAGRSASTDPFADAVAIWTALHGQVVLRAHLPHFPWPPTDGVEQVVLRLARITDPPTGP